MNPGHTQGWASKWLKEARSCQIYKFYHCCNRLIGIYFPLLADTVLSTRTVWTGFNSLQRGTLSSTVTAIHLIRVFHTSASHLISLADVLYVCRRLFPCFWSLTASIERELSLRQMGGVKVWNLNKYINFWARGSLGTKVTFGYFKC